MNQLDPSQLAVAARGTVITTPSPLQPTQPSSDKFPKERIMNMVAEDDFLRNYKLPLLYEAHSLRQKTRRKRTHLRCHMELCRSSIKPPVRHQSLHPAKNELGRMHVSMHHASLPSQTLYANTSLQQYLIKRLYTNNSSWSSLPYMCKEWEKVNSGILNSHLSRTSIPRHTCT